MPVEALEPLIRKIHHSRTPLVLLITGGGMGTISQLLQVPGASRTVLEATAPYSSEALIDWLGSKPEQFCSARTARAMAMAAFSRARQLTAMAESIAVKEVAPSSKETCSSGQGLSDAVEALEGRTIAPVQRLAGVACTASLASDRPKKGAHRAHLALQTADFTITHSVQLEAGRRSRLEEDTVVTSLLVNLIAEAGGLDERVEPGLSPREPIAVTRTDALPAWRELMLGPIRRIRASETDAQDAATVTEPRVIFPGAFNPLHQGHLRMAELATQRLGSRTEFELSIENVDKPPLNYTEMEHRAKQFGGEHPLWYTRAATFEEKSRQFPGATFVVGADTITRIADAKYFGGDIHACYRALRHIAQNGCRFLVFGREKQGRFQTLNDLQIPTTLRVLCQGIAEDAFREDISSTELRRK